MTTVKDIIAEIEKVAPLQLQEEYDNAGLQAGLDVCEVSGVVTCLDVSESVVLEAIKQNANMIVSHHPLLFRPIKRITKDDYIGRTLLAALQAGIAIYSAHTNLDNAYGGVNYKMAEKLGLSDVRPLAPLPSQRLAGVENAEMCGSGVVGMLPEALTTKQFLDRVNDAFKCNGCIRLNNLKPKTISKVALCGGSGADFIADAEREMADAFVTGEIGYHRFFGHEKILLVEAGHYETEQYTSELLRDIILKAFPEMPVYIVK